MGSEVLTEVNITAVVIWDVTVRSGTWLPVSYGYDHQHNNKVGYLWVKTKTDVVMYITYLI
jgi:hypothetical protein